MSTAGVPPSNNMGAEITAPLVNRVLIDWFSWTVKVLDPHEAINMSGLSALSFTESKGGGMGYKRTLRSGNIVVFYDGSENMGCHISMSGEGCRLYESVQRVKHCWYQLLHRLASIGATITRVDVAMDNVDGSLDLDKLMDAIKSKSVRSRFRGGHKIEKFTFTDDEENGRTIYLGSPSSRIKFRFYDKAAQYHIECHWVRCELQLMAERAQEFAQYLIKGMLIGEIACSVLNNYFSVINKDDINISRCSLAAWWAAWLTNYQRISLTVAKSLRIVPQVIDHIKRQYSASFALCREYLGVVSFHEFVHDLISTGKEKMTKKHQHILQSTYIETGMVPAVDLPF